MLEIVLYPDPILRRTSEAITVIDDDLRQFVKQMIEVMYEDKGVGLAAPQVGVNKRVIVFDVNMDEEEPHVLINPVITSKSREKEAIDEGCLSLPGLTAKIRRPAEVTVEGLDLDGNKVTYQGGELLARCLQHEIDHLDGILFIDKASTAAKLSLRSELKEMEAEYLKKHSELASN